jgi:hypothetical protein
MTIGKLKTRMLSSSLPERRKAAAEAEQLSPKELRSLFKGYRFEVDKRAVHPGKVYVFTGGEWSDAMLSAFIRRADPKWVALRKTVKQIYVRLGPKASALAAFEAFPAVERLVVVNAPGLTHLDQLTYWRRLQDLQVQAPVSENLTSVEGLRDLPALRRVFLGNCESLTSLDPLATLTALEELTLKWVSAKAEDPEVFAGLTGLRELELSGWSTLKDLSCLRACTRLESLTLCELPALTSLNGLEGLKHLKRLEVKWGADALKDLSAVEGLPGLERLALPATP